MKRPDILRFVVGLSTDELNFTTWETNQIITIRARDIHGVEQQPSGKEFPADSGSVSRIYWHDTSVLVRRSRLDVLADIAALVPVIPTGNVYVQDQKANGTNGGAGVAGSFQTRDLNTITDDPAGLATLASNQLTLLAGTYLTLIFVPGVETDGFRARLRDITASSTISLGSNAHTGRDDVQVQSVIQDLFTISVTSTLEVQMRQDNTPAAPNNSFGLANGFAGIEIYTIARFRRIG